MPIPFIVLGSYVLGALGAYGAMSYFQNSEALSKAEDTLKSMLPNDDIIQKVTAEKLQELMDKFTK